MTNIIVVSAWAVFIIYWVVSSFRVKRDINRRAAWWAWTRVILLAVVISWVASVGKIGQATHRIETLYHPTSAVLGVIGAILVVIGVAFAVWARVHLGRNWSPVPSIKEGHELVTSGPYRFVRHPIYTGMILAMIGSALSLSVWFLVAVAFCILFIRRVRIEEKLMTKQFPDQYPSYKKRTWALFPYIY